MNAEEHLQLGHLSEALAALEASVRKDPADAKLRIFLFQLLAVLGDWKRSGTQLSVAGEMDADNATMVRAYREALRCEVLRAEVFSGKRTPVIFGEPDQWVASLIEALMLSCGGEEAAARALRDKAFEEAPASAGTINGEPFEWLADADMRLGPMLEVIIAGRYQWMPMHHVHSMIVEPPEDLRDFVWMPATLTLSTGGEIVALMPSRYPGTESSSDDLLKLGRKTEWKEVGEGTYVGLGQRVFTTDAGDYPLFDVRSVEMKNSAPPPTEDG